MLLSFEQRLRSKLKIGHIDQGVIHCIHNFFFNKKKNNHLINTKCQWLYPYLMGTWKGGKADLGRIPELCAKVCIDRDTHIATRIITKSDKTHQTLLFSRKTLVVISIYKRYMTETAKFYIVWHSHLLVVCLPLCRENQRFTYHVPMRQNDLYECFSI